jgi:flavin reductase (DIM6/NTAB) family NADH-FMN oxidoreductase RutF
MGRSKPHDRIRVIALSRPAPSSHSGSAQHFDAEAFRKACARFATGVTVATVRASDGTPHGLTISSFTSVSIQPPLILICIDYACAFLSHFRACTNFAINVLNESQRDLSVTFAQKPEGRFEGVDWCASETGAPLLRGCIANIECRLSSVIEAGDHAIFLGEVIHAEAYPGLPLLYFNRDYRALR